MSRILLIRHGETDWNKMGRWQGFAPIPLNEEGHTQARILATYLKKRNESITALYSSDLPRCRQTAEYIAQAIGLPIRLDRRLREIDLGLWQGLTKEEIMAWDPDGWQANLPDSYNYVKDGGESTAQAGKRAVQCLQEAIAGHASESTLLMVSHGGTMRGIMVETGLLDKHARIHFENTAITVLQWDHRGQQWHLESSPNVDHLNHHALDSAESMD
jgi:2,3-bisphosphoglycerate-dependent phosphoglycerate mutase